MSPDAPGAGAAEQGGGGLLALFFPETEAPVLVKGAPEIREGLRLALRGWDPVLAPIESLAGMGRAPLSVVRPMAAGGYRTASRFLDAPLEDLPLASAVCAVTADLAQSFYETQPQASALHAGAFAIRGRLVALTGAARAGKSTLVARLSAEPDLEVIGDDVLPILADGRAHGLGIAPRLRLPLPPEVGPTLRAHAARHCLLRDSRYGYLLTPNLAPFGYRAPLAAVVELERRAGEPARLSRMAPEEALAHLQAQSMRTPLMAEAGAFRARLAALAESAICLRLTYADLDEAAALLRGAFGGEAPLSPQRLGG